MVLNPKKHKKHKEKIMSELESEEVVKTLNLKELGVPKFTEVWTDDEVRIGQAFALHHRLKDVNPALKLYATYLETKSIQMGGPVFIPTDFIETYLPDDNKLILDVDFTTVKRETWDRTPDFIAHRTSQIEMLD